MIRFLAPLALVAMLLPVSAVQAQDAKSYKTAYINMQTVFEGYYKTIQANVEFAEQKRDFLAKLRVKREAIQPLEEKAKKLQAQMQDGLASESAKRDAARDFRLVMEEGATKQREFINFRQSGRAEVEKQRLAAEGQLIEELTRFVVAWCESKGYDVVYDINGKSLNRMPVLLVYPKELEITDDVAKAVNAGHEVEMKAAQDKLKEVEDSLAADLDAEN
jgi:Skp family chaperone for outer membrane proteins